MLKRLADEGVVDYQPYHGARLTPEGERIALEVIRHHRLIELFLAEVLGMPWDRVARRGRGARAPHLRGARGADRGQARRAGARSAWRPDPRPDLAISADDSVPLTDLDPGEQGVFTRVSDSDASMLRYLAERSIQPGAGSAVKAGSPSAAR